MTARRPSNANGDPSQVLNNEATLMFWSKLSAMLRSLNSVGAKL